MITKSVGRIALCFLLPLSCRKLDKILSDLSKLPYDVI